ncbi:MAG: prepilin-type N-terminal cleavage/methylation domain-containing protein [Fibrobacter sp.]|uniref:prepilin-type N-terminal cleavage/methylation domain-containing protein n=1 Tax=Fibrobacter sp. TaxID=35828 RepID=UPI0038906644|nr:prepilin-type N-terminal cleavage/methylation domain-containing protein [Fibrobacter sp.]
MNRKGFTLIELMVAVACSAILVASVWQCFSLFHGTFVRLVSDYGTQFEIQMDDIRKVMKNARGLGGRLESRF